jgi:hypothetical protein
MVNFKDFSNFKNFTVNFKDFLQIRGAPLTTLDPRACIISINLIVLFKYYRWQHFKSNGFINRTGLPPGL